MNKAVAVIVGIALFIFIAPVTVFAGCAGGCLFGAILSPMNDAFVGPAMVGGALLGLGAGVVIPILVVRGIRASSH